MTTHDHKSKITVVVVGLESDGSRSLPTTALLLSRWAVPYTKIIIRLPLIDNHICKAASKPWFYYIRRANPRRRLVVDRSPAAVSLDP